MALHSLPTRSGSTLLTLRQDLDARDPVRDLLERGWQSFRETYLEGLPRLEKELKAKGHFEAYSEFLGEVYWLRSEVYLHVECRARAYADLLRALDFSPEDPRILDSLLRIEMAHFRLGKAQERLQELRRLDPEWSDLDLFVEDLESGLEQGLETELAQRLEKALRDLKRGDLGAKATLEAIGDLYYEGLRPDLARVELERALVRGSVDPELHFLAAEVGLELGDLDFALERIAELQKVRPQDDRAYLFAIDLRIAQGDRRGALKALQALIGKAVRPLQLTTQDIFFLADLAEDEEFHAVWIQLLDRHQVSPESVGYYYSSGTPAEFFSDRLGACRIYHQAQMLSLRSHLGDHPAELDRAFQKLLKQAPDYTLLLDEYARFLLRVEDSPLEQAVEMAERAVYLSEVSGEPEDRFHQTLEDLEKDSSRRLRQ